MPLWIKIIKGNEEVFRDKLSSTFTRKDLIRAIRYIGSRYQRKFSALLNFLHQLSSPPLQELLEEILDLACLLTLKEGELPQAFFFVPLPEDFDEVKRLLQGFPTELKVVCEEGVYYLRGGFGEAYIEKNGVRIKNLKAGEKIEICALKAKVFAITCKAMMRRFVGTLATVLCLAQRLGGELLELEESSESPPPSPRRPRCCSSSDKP